MKSETDVAITAGRIREVMYGLYHELHRFPLETTAYAQRHWHWRDFCVPGRPPPEGQILRITATGGREYLPIDILNAVIPGVYWHYGIPSTKNESETKLLVGFSIGFVLPIVVLVSTKALLALR